MHGTAKIREGVVEATSQKMKIEMWKNKRYSKNEIFCHVCRGGAC
jgi:hypothetical protein